MKSIVCILAIFLGLSAHAATDGKSRIEGYVLSFDPSVVVIESGNQKVEIPRKLYTERVTVGEKISVEVDDQTFEKLKKEKMKAAKK